MNSGHYKDFGPLNCDHNGKSPIDVIIQFKIVDKI